MIGPRELLFSMIFALVAVGSASAASYYVTQSGAGSKNGLSLANAWSVANFNASATPTGGDTVFFSGTITSEVVPNTSGTGTGANVLTLDFTGATVNISNDPEIMLNGKSYLTLLGGTFATDAGNHGLIRCYTAVAHDITVSGWTYTGPDGGTDLFFRVGYCGANLLIQNNHMDNVVSCVNSYEAATNGPVTILNNYCRTSINTVQQTDVINMGDTRNVLIQGNMLIQRSPGQNNNGQHNDVIQTYKGGGGGSQNPSGWTIRYNWVGLEMETPERTGDNSWMMMENLDDSSGFACKVYGNVFYGGKLYFSGNNGWGCSTTSSATFYFYNNTAIRHLGPNGGVGCNAGSTAYMRNNAGQDDAGQSGRDFGMSCTAGATWDYNFWYLTQGCSGTDSGSHGSCSTDNLFTDFANDNFAPAVGSPLINGGDSTIGAEYNQGIAPGATWPNPTLVTRTAGAWDVGAYQSGTSAQNRPNPPTGLSAVVQ